MPKMTGGEALVKQLHREGVRVVFGLPGVQLYGAMAALRDEKDMRFILTRHEQATTYMADGYARAGGGIGVALVVPGRGAARPTRARRRYFSSPARCRAATSARTSVCCTRSTSSSTRWRRSPSGASACWRS